MDRTAILESYGGLPPSAFVLSPQGAHCEDLSIAQVLSLNDFSESYAFTGIGSVSDEPNFLSPEYHQSKGTKPPLYHNEISIGSATSAPKMDLFVRDMCSQWSTEQTVQVPGLFDISLDNFDSAMEVTSTIPQEVTLPNDDGLFASQPLDLSFSEACSFSTIPLVNNVETSFDCIPMTSTCMSPSNKAGKMSLTLHQDNSTSLPKAIEEQPSVATGRFVIAGKARELLQSSFYQRPYPNREEQEQLAHKTDLTFSQVKTWFNNRRSRLLKKGAYILICAGCLLTSRRAHQGREAETRAE
jgi:hypothetical protein